MKQRDHTFLLDIAKFVYMNRVATAFALGQSIVNPEPIATLTIRGIHGQPHELMGADHQEALIKELSQARIATIQSIMIARIFAELIAAYEDLAAFGWAVRSRNSGQGKGIFVNYVKTRNGDPNQFFQHVIKEVGSSTRGNPPSTLGDLLNLPSLIEMRGKVPQELLTDLDKEN